MYLLIKSYLNDCYFQVRIGTSYSGVAKISADVLLPTLYNIYAADQPISPNTTVAEFVDDKAIISIHEGPQIAFLYLQFHLDLLTDFYNKWRIKINQSKSLPPCSIVSPDNIQIPTTQSA